MYPSSPGRMLRRTVMVAVLALGAAATNCFPEHCENGSVDVDETDVDCGGFCARCPDGKRCNYAGDCASGVCDPDGGSFSSSGDSGTTGGVGGGGAGGEPTPNPTNGVCVPCVEDEECGVLEYCGDGVCLDQRADGRDCSRAGMCRSSHCVDSVCCHDACDGLCRTCSWPGSIGQCSDQPPAVDLDEECDGEDTCDGAGQCRCGNGSVDGKETDMDCGGPDCPPRCGPDERCIDFSDCVSILDCLAGICAVPPP